MRVSSSLFRSSDKPQNSTIGSTYSFFFGGTTSGKTATEQSSKQTSSAKIELVR